MGMIKGPEPHPWLQPLYRRIAVFVFCIGWVIFEIFQNDLLWLAIAIAAALYAAWNFFLSGTYSNIASRQEK